MTTFAALGDSITLGIGDPVPAGGDRTGWRGWALLLADGLIEPELHILAASGARVADIERDQLPRALALRPDIASVVFGINDTLRPGFDPELIESSAARTVGALRASGAQVLTMRLPDAGRMLRLPGALARPLAARTQQINTVLDGIAVRFGTLHFDAAGTPEAYDRQMWAADRLHPNERGHRLIARSFHGLLAGAGHRLGPPPSAEPGQPAAEPDPSGRLAGHQGDRLGAAQVHRPRALPGRHGRQGPPQLHGPGRPEAASPPQPWPIGPDRDRVLGARCSRRAHG